MRPAIDPRRRSPPDDAPSTPHLPEMAAPDFYNPPLASYPSPLTGYEGLPPLGDDKNEDGKSLKNAAAAAAAARSPAYDAFVDPLDRGRRGGL